MKNIAPIFRPALAAALVISSAFSALADEGGTWTHELRFDTLPTEQTPKWIKRGEGTTTVDGNKLVIATQGDENAMFTLMGESGGEGWDSTAPSTLEFRVAVVEKSGPQAAQVNVIRNDQVFFIPLTRAEPTTYRLVIEGDEAMLYIDGNAGEPLRSRPHRVDRSRNHNSVLFGDGSTVGSGTTEWTLFRWLLGEARRP